MIAREYGWLALAALPVWLLCLVCALALWFTQVRPLRPHDLGVICGAVRVTYGVQIGVAWVSPQTVESGGPMPAPYYWNRNHKWSLCGRIPWVSVLYDFRGFVFP